MKKYFFLLVLSAMAAACTEDLEDDVDSLMEVRPLGMVLLENELLVQNSNNCEIPFRVNPSHYKIQEGDILLDVFSSEIQRSFPVTSIAEYRLDSVVPVKDNAGNVKEGEWKAVVHVEDGKYYSGASMALVLKYQDATGKECMLTSSNIASMKTVPVMTEDMVEVNNYQTISAWDNTDNLNAQEFSITPAPISSGSQVLFDMEGTRIDSFRLEGDNAAKFQLTRLSDGQFRIEPNFFFSIPDSCRFVDVDLAFYFKDLYCSDAEEGTVVKRKNMKFYKTRVTPEMRVIGPEDFASQDTVGSSSPKVMVPLKDVFALCGITDDAFDHENYTLSCTSMKIVDNEGNMVRLPLLARFKMKEGFVYPSNAFIQLSLYAGMKDELYDHPFNVKATFVYIDVRTGQKRFFCEMTYPMTFKK